MLPFNCFPNGLISSEGNASDIILVLKDKQGSERQAGVATAREDVFMAKYQNLSAPFLNDLFQGNSQADKSGTTRWSELSVPSVPSVPQLLQPSK